MIQPNGKERISKIDTYLNVAEVFAYRSTCIKRKYGAVIVKDDVVVSTGYQGEGYGICRAIHAEQNALLNCSREQTLGADLYLTGINPEDNSIYRAKPCPLCARLIVQAGIRRVIMRVGSHADEYVIISPHELKWHN